MKIKRIYKRTLWLLAALFLSLFCLFESALSIVASASSKSSKNYDETRIEDDLSDLDFLKYRLTNHVDIVRVQEYCYTDNPFAQYYGLYIYVYNPAKSLLNRDGLPFKKDGNVVNMAAKYDENGEPKSYDNWVLKFLDKTEDNRFYKFKVDDASKLYNMAKGYAETHEGKRRYDLASFQFRLSNGDIVNTADDVKIGKTCIYSGYAAGCAPNAGIDDSTSTLKCSSQKLETLKVDIKHTNYLMDNYGVEKDNVCDNLHTVYFPIPERYFEENLCMPGRK
jgi:hypothetical protein